MLFRLFTAGAAATLLVCSLLIFGSKPTVAVGGPRWVTVDTREFATVASKLANGGDNALASAKVDTELGGIGMIELEDDQIDKLSREMHSTFDKCAGFMSFATRAEASEALAAAAAFDPNQQFVTYTIDNQTNVNALFAATSEPQTRQVILDLSAIPNRRHNQQGGLDGAAWIKNKWTALAAGRSDVTVEYFNHNPTTVSPQPSVIMTIQGQTLPNEIVVLGGHQDSINLSGQTLSAPGADDDASGIASLTETIRVLMAKGFRPNRTVKFMAYSAEEVGLKGSADIAANFQTNARNVVGVMQLDMTNYKGSGFDIVLFQDYTNAAQNTFVNSLITTYQPTLLVGTDSCGYACSDHASWSTRGYPTSMPFEATMTTDNPRIHSANDTLAQIGGDAVNSMKFAKLAISFVGELAKGAVAPTRKTVVDFDGDSKTDVSIFRPSNGEWWINRSATNATVAAQFGASTDVAVPSDFTGDGKADIAFFRPSTGFWFVLRSEDSSFFSFPFGASGDTPLAVDFDGDGKTDPAVFRSSNNTWYISKTTGGTSIVTFGAAGDKAVPADFDGDGKADIAIFRPSTGEWWINRSSTGVTVAAQFGTATDKPVAGDYTGDGKADIAFFRPSTGFWFILRSEDASFFSFPFGASTDLPAPGDYDGDGKFDAAVFRSSDTNWYINRSTAGVAIQQFGAATDVPLPNRLLP